MENLIYYSIAKYIPSVERNESINFGFSFFAPGEKKIGYIPSKNNKRILAFDDETTQEEIDFLQESLKYDFSEDSFRFIEDELVEKYFLTNEPLILQDKIYNYANIIQFDTIKPLVIEKNFKQSLKDITDFFLYYDIPVKDRRMNKAKLFSLTKNTIKAYLEKDTYTKIKHDSNSLFHKPYDFETILNNEIHFIKIIKFDYIHPSDLYKELKSLIVDIEHFNNKESFKITPKNFNIVINSTDFSSNHELEAFKVMKDYANIFPIHELPNFLSNDKNI